jgi:hypothetical protein
MGVCDPAGGTCGTGNERVRKGVSKAVVGGGDPSPLNLQNDCCAGNAPQHVVAVSSENGVSSPNKTNNSVCERDEESFSPNKTNNSVSQSTGRGSTQFPENNSEAIFSLNQRLTGAAQIYVGYHRHGRACPGDPRTPLPIVAMDGRHRAGQDKLGVVAQASDGRSRWWSRAQAMASS